MALQITERLLSDLEPQHLQLIDGSYLEMLHMMLDSPYSKMRIMATKSVRCSRKRIVDPIMLHNH